MRGQVSASAGECECRCVRVCVHELVIALTQDKAMWEMFNFSEVF